MILLGQFLSSPVGAPPRPWPGEGCVAVLSSMFILMEEIILSPSARQERIILALNYSNCIKVVTNNTHGCSSQRPWSCSFFPFIPLNVLFGLSLTSRKMCTAPGCSGLVEVTLMTC